MADSTDHIITNDHSPSLFSRQFGETYHSKFGAITESEKVFVKHGLLYCLSHRPVLNVFEVGFGTGLNAMLSIKSLSAQQFLYYTAIELFPLKIADIQWIAGNLPASDAGILQQLHHASWGVQVPVTSSFSLYKIHDNLLNIQLDDTCYDLVYFDAFSPEAQPEMWSAEVMQKMFQALKPGGVLTTYSSKGLVKNALRTAGFEQQRLPGPPGKRHVLRALKPKNLSIE